MRVGIDPGKTGAIVVLSDPHLTYMHHWPMPIMQLGTKERVNGCALKSYLEGFVGMNAAINLEHVNAMPGEASNASFSFGFGCGVIVGVLQALELPFNLVTPQAWKRQAGLIGTDKEAARSRAIQLYPGLRDLDLKGKGQALADAIFIARFKAA